MNELYHLSLAEMRTRLDAGDVTASQLTESMLSRIANYDATIGAYLHVDADGARAQASAADARLKAGERGGMLGIPLGIKDVLSTDGLPTTCASKVLEGYRPAHILRAFLTGKPAPAQNPTTKG